MKWLASILISTILISNFAFAQEMNYSERAFSKKSNIHGRPNYTDGESPFSLKVGYNISNVLISPAPYDFTGPKRSFHVGIVANNIQFNDYVGFQPELLYSIQGFKVAGVGNVGLHYLSMPLLMKLEMGRNASVLFGPQISYLTSARIGLGVDLLTINYSNLFQRVDASLVGGLEFKMGKNTSIGARYQLGLNDINKDFNIGPNNTYNDYFSIRNSTGQFYMTFHL
jgi:Outer membrane protein beta-barrel domain